MLDAWGSRFGLPVLGERHEKDFLAVWPNEDNA
jgi:hypothetical protein